MSTVLYLGYCRPSFWSRVFSGHIFTTLRSFLAAGMRGWHERSDPRSEKSGIDTLHGDILAVVRHVFFLLEEVGADWCKGTFGRRWSRLP